jgi:hypothetical protein
MLPRNGALQERQRLLVHLRNALERELARGLREEAPGQHRQSSRRSQSRGSTISSSRSDSRGPRGSALLGHQLEVLMRRREDPHVDLDRVLRADRRHDPVLEHAQDLGLQVERHVADLVEEQRPAVRLLEVPRARLRRPVNAPFSCPNSMLSMSCSGIAAQLTGTKGPFLRRDRSCRARRR